MVHFDKEIPLKTERTTLVLLPVTIHAFVEM